MDYRVLGWVGLLAAASVVAGQTRPSLPRKTDLGPEFHRFGLTPRSQGGRDTCSLFAVTALAELESARATSGRHKQLSVEFLIWAANEATGRGGDQAMFYEAVHGLNVLGICADELMPYAGRRGAERTPSAAALADARGRARRWQVHWIRRWDVKRPLSDAQVLAVKAALAGGHPVACGLRWPKVLAGHKLVGVPPPDKVYDGHSVVLTGYQDDPAKDGEGVFLFRNSSGPRWGDGGTGVMSYAYARAYANDVLWLGLGPPSSEVPLERFEAESLAVLARDRCDTSEQDMGTWGGPMWSGGKQLFCSASRGGFVELGFAVRKRGRYRLRVLATAAPDFGTVRAALDGKPAGPVSDLYSGRVCPSGSLELGTHDLTAGPHSLRFTAAGRNAASAGWLFGLDAIDLLSAK